MGIDINFGALQAPNPFGAYAQGQEYGQQQRMRQAQQAAGNVFATDPDKAAQILASAGDIDSAARVQQLAASRRSAASRTKAAQLYTSGDVKGAQAEALSSGDSETLNAISKLSDEQKAALHESESNIANVGYSLAPLPYEQRKARLAVMAQSAQTPEQKQAYLNFDPTDDNIHTRVSQALGVTKMIELSKPVEMDPTKNYYVSDLAGGGSAPSAQAPQAQAPQSQPASGSQPRGLRNNNPLNVTSLGGGQHWDGQTGADGNYAVFDSPAAGIAAADKNLTAYGSRHGINTLAGVISRWAPASENNTQAYVGTVAKDLGIDPNQHIDLGNPQVRHAVLRSMAKVELGQALPEAGAQPYQVASNGPTPPPPSMPGYHLVSQGQQQWQADGKGTLVNTATGDRKKDPSFVDGSTGGADANIVKGLIEGRIAPPTQKAAASDYWQAQLKAAAEQDPSFDMVNFGARSAARKDFTSGKSAQNITALNTVIGHLDHLDRAIDDLGNAGPGGALNFGPLNSVNNKAANWFAQKSGTDVRYKNFETAKTAVANELTRVFRGTGGAEADIQGWMKQLESAGSPEALHGVVRSMAELINSRVEALGEQYGQGMGTTKDPITLLTSDKRKAFTRMMGGAPKADAAPQAGSAAPVRVTSPQEAMRLPPGTVFVTPDGRRKVR